MIKIGKYFNSVGIVIFFVGIYTIGLTEATATLLWDSFAHMHPIPRIISSILMAAVIDGFMLVITVNMYLMKDRFGNHILPIVFGIFSTVMTLFFLEAFDVEQETITMCKKWFLSIVIGTINYLLNEIFIKKWEEHIANENEENRLLEENEKLKERMAELAKELEAFDHRVITLQSQVDHFRSLDYDGLMIKHHQLVTDLELKGKKLARPKAKGVPRKKKPAIV